MGKTLLSLIIITLFVVQAGKIDHIIILMEENRSFDHFFGWAKDLLGVNGLNGDESNSLNTSDPNSTSVFVDKESPYIGPCDPNHGTGATTDKIFGKDAVSHGNFSNPSMSGFVEFEKKHKDYCGVMKMFTPDRIPVITALASEFAIMDRFFCSHPGPTWPNRLFAISGTSAGLTETGPWYRNKNGNLFTQKTIFDQVEAVENLTWANYYNDTPWEIFHSVIAHNPNNVKSMEQFWEDARSGSLPSYAWINPRSGINITTGIGSNDQHPDHDVRAGERYYKDIYEALRASPQWNSTLFIITMDEHGGFFDHVSTPLDIPPPGDGETSYPDKNFVFDRLGVRIPTILISPWIPKGTVISAPPKKQKPKINSEYDLTSIIATARKLLSMPNTPLTDRDAWAATFEHVFSMEKARTDCPLHMPDVPSIEHNQLESETNLPLNDLQRDIASVHAHLSGHSFPHHIENQGNISSWLQVHYAIHAERTHSWKKSKLDNTYILQCGIARNSWSEKSWNVSRGDSGWDTVSTIHLKSDQAKPYCLDAGDAKNNTQISVSECYPSPLPSNNRDSSQQWILNPDATLRPFHAQSLCLTSRFFSMNNSSVFLEVCRDAVEQHWAYHGKAPGNSGEGYLYFGDAAFALVLKTRFTGGLGIFNSTFLPRFSHRKIRRWLQKNSILSPKVVPPGGTTFSEGIKFI